MKSTLSVAVCGVHFELDFGFASPMTVPSALEPYCMAPDGAPTVAQVRCAVARDRKLGLELGGLNHVRWRHTGERGERITLRNNRTCADIVRIAPRDYRVQARIADTEEAMAAMLRFVGAAVVEAEGGLNLHAASVVLDGEAFAFCGPSGAGKSTAVDLCPSGQCLSYDQLSAYPYAGRFWAWAHPWGQSSSLARDPVCARPLRALLRVTRGYPETRVEWAAPERALFLVRDATTVSDYTLEGENSRLSACFTLCNNVQVGHLNTVLGRHADSVLRQAIAKSSDRP